MPPARVRTGRTLASDRPENATPDSPNLLPGARAQQAQACAAGSRSQLHAVFAASPIGMLLVDGGGRIALVNAEVERLFGYLSNELLGEPVETLVPELDREAHARQRASFGAEAQSRRMAGSREVTGVDKRGRALTLDIGLVPIATPEGRFVLATLTDLGARRLLERARGVRAQARRLLDAEEAQRKRMAREIHDALGQALTALRLDIGWLAAQLPEGPLLAHATAMEDRAAATIAEVRRLSAELRPSILDDQGLLPAIRWLVGDVEKRSALRCSLALPDEPVGWSEPRCTTAYRVLQESLTNVLRHAQAGKVTVALWPQQPGEAVLEVRDDGSGFNQAQARRPGALGLLGMRERALLHGGSLTVLGEPGVGTTVTLRMPCGPDELQPDAAPGPVATAHDSRTKKEGR